MPFAAEVLAAIPGLSHATTLFVSRAKPGNEKAIAKVEGLGVRVVRRRVTRDDVLFVGEEADMGLDAKKGAGGDGDVPCRCGGEAGCTGFVGDRDVLFADA